METFFGKNDYFLSDLQLVGHFYLGRTYNLTLNNVLGYAVRLIFQGYSSVESHYRENGAEIGGWKKLFLSKKGRILMLLKSKLSILMTYCLSLLTIQSHLLN